MAGSLTYCAHCGLPAPSAARFCCYGCELASRIRAEARDDHAQLFGTLSFTLVLAMIVMMLSLFLYAEDVFDAAADVEMAWMRAAYRWASWLLATPVMALGGLPLARRSLDALRVRRLSMEALIALGAFAAYGLSVYNLFAKRSGVYFDSATTAVVLATFGRYLEATARSRASRSLGPLLEVTRGTVTVLGSDGARREVAAAEVEPAMRLEVGPEQVVPVDLRLDMDSAEIDLAVLTGESRPVLRRRGQTVPAGAVPASSAIVGLALRASRDSALERLAALARSLGERPSRTLRWSDRFAAALTPVVAVVAGAALVRGARTTSLGEGIVTALAVLLAACPCSYAIAAPLVHWLMLRRAFTRGVLIRSADALEALARVRSVAFDKTGTLTRPELSVTAERLGAGSDGGVEREEVRAIVRALEEGSAHPVARALSRHVGPGGVAPIRERRLVPGRGVQARDPEGRDLSLGAGPDGTVVLARAGRTLATFALEEQLRPEAPEAVAMLREQQVDVIMLSGDDASRVEPVASALGIAAEARLTPEEKTARMAALGDGAAMVGDGINDTPALAGRLTSFTFGGAAQLAKGVAQVVLVEQDLRLVPWTLGLARRGVRLVKWLIGTSTAYNAVFVALAAAGALKPVWAGLSMLMSSLLALSFAAGIGGVGEHGEDEVGALVAESC